MRDDALRCRVPRTPAAGLSANRLRHLSGWERQEAVGALRLATKLAALPAAPAVPLSGPVVIWYRLGWEKGRRRLDPDGAVAACKPALDGLVDAGWLVGDGPDVIAGFMVSQHRDPDGRGWLDVSVTALGDGA